MAHEAQLWATIRNRVALHGHFERIENMVSAGRPDVNYCVKGIEGNIELKHVDRWPARPDTVLPLPHYTPQQRNWHRIRLSAGGRVYVLLQVADDYLLLHADWARQYLGVSATRADIVKQALVHGVRRFPTEQVIKQLTLYFSRTWF
jgi:hypothetical protein